MIHWTPLAVAILGALVYAFAEHNGKVSRLGEILLFCGLFWAVSMTQHAGSLGL